MSIFRRLPPGRTDLARLWRLMEDDVNDVARRVLDRVAARARPAAGRPAPPPDQEIPAPDADADPQPDALDADGRPDADAPDVRGDGPGPTPPP